MKVWCFKGAGGLWVLAGDSTGEQLPAHLGPWSVHQEAELSNAADDEREAIDLIDQHGFCCFRNEEVGRIC